MFSYPRHVAPDMLLQQWAYLSLSMHAEMYTLHMSSQFCVCAMDSNWLNKMAVSGSYYTSFTIIYLSPPLINTHVTTMRKILGNTPAHPCTHPLQPHSHHSHTQTLTHPYHSPTHPYTHTTHTPLHTHHPHTLTHSPPPLHTSP